MPFQDIVKALYQYHAEDEDELSFEEDDLLCIIGCEQGIEWWTARPLTQPDIQGQIPSNYVESLESLGGIKALYGYEAHEDNELGFADDETLQLMSRLEDEWWLAKNEAGLCGLVPSNYFEEVEGASGDELFASHTRLDRDSSDAPRTFECPATYSDDTKKKRKGKLCLSSRDDLFFICEKRNTQLFKFALEDVINYDRKTKKLGVHGVVRPIGLELSKSDATSLSELIEWFKSRAAVNAAEIKIESADADPEPSQPFKIEAIHAAPLKASPATSWNIVETETLRAVSPMDSANSHDDLEEPESDPELERLAAVREKEAAATGETVSTMPAGEPVVSSMQPTPAGLDNTTPKRPESPISPARMANSELHSNVQNILAEKPAISMAESSISPIAVPIQCGPALAAKTKLKALFDYEAVNDDELGLAENEALLLINAEDPNWWMVQRLDDSEKQGLVPSNYIEVVREESPKDQMKTSELEQSLKETSNSEEQASIRPAFLDELLVRTKKSFENLKVIDEIARRPSLSGLTKNSMPIPGIATSDPAIESPKELVSASPLLSAAAPITCASNVATVANDIPATISPSRTIPTPPPPPSAPPARLKNPDPPIKPSSQPISKPDLEQASGDVVRKYGEKSSAQFRRGQPHDPNVSTSTIKATPKPLTAPVQLPTVQLRKTSGPHDHEHGDKKPVSHPNKATIKSPLLASPKVPHALARDPLKTKRNPWANMPLKKTPSKPTKPSSGDAAGKSLPDRPVKANSTDKPIPANTRLWTDRTGKFQVEAEFLRFENAQVYLHKLNGSRISVPLGKFSDRDAEYVHRKCGLPYDRKRLSSSASNAIPTANNDSTADTSHGGFNWLGFFDDCGIPKEHAISYARKFAAAKVDGSIVNSGKMTRECLRDNLVREGDITLIFDWLSRQRIRLLEAETAKKNLKLIESQLKPTIASNESNMIASVSRNSNPLQPVPGANTVSSKASAMSPNVDSQGLPGVVKPPKNINVMAPATTAFQNTRPAATLISQQSSNNSSMYYQHAPFPARQLSSLAPHSTGHTLEICPMQAQQTTPDRAAFNHSSSNNHSTYSLDPNSQYVAADPRTFASHQGHRPVQNISSNYSTQRTTSSATSNGGNPHLHTAASSQHSYVNGYTGQGALANYSAQYSMSSANRELAYTPNSMTWLPQPNILQSGLVDNVHQPITHRTTMQPPPQSQQFAQHLAYNGTQVSAYPPAQYGNTSNLRSHSVSDGPANLTGQGYVDPYLAGSRQNSLGNPPNLMQNNAYHTTNPTQAQHLYSLNNTLSTGSFPRPQAPMATPNAPSSVPSGDRYDVFKWVNPNAPSMLAPSRPPQTGNVPDSSSPSSTSVSYTQQHYSYMSNGFQ